MVDVCERLLEHEVAKARLRLAGKLEIEHQLRAELRLLKSGITEKEDQSPGVRPVQEETYRDCMRLLKCCEVVVRPHVHRLGEGAAERAVKEFVTELGG